MTRYDSRKDGASRTDTLFDLHAHPICSFIGAHDSAFVGDVMQPMVNQEVSVTGQLDAGIRFLQSQTHEDMIGNLSMCHTSCYLEYAGSVTSYLSTIKSWLDKNPHEILTLLLVNGDHVDVSAFDSAFKAADLRKYAFVPPKSPNFLKMQDWPTLQQMISIDKRLVVFLDSGAKQSLVPYILPELSQYIFETPYDTTDPDFSSCTLDRPAGATADGRMFLLNHFLDSEIAKGIMIPDNDADFQTNSAEGNGSIGAHVDVCEQAFGRRPNFVLVDMFDRGDVMEAQRRLNFG